MRRSLLVINAIVVVVFVVGFVLTFAARRMIEGRAQGFVAERTRQYAEPAVKAAEGALTTPGVRKFLGDEVVAAAQGEIDSFRENPAGFIAGLVGSGDLKKSEGVQTRFSDKIHGWKEKVRDYFESLLGKLLLDLRIFSASNVVGGAIAFVLAWKSGDRGRIPLVVASAVMLLAVLFATWMYIADYSFFMILRDSFMGWWYPVLIVILCFAILIDYGRALTALSHETESN